MRAGNVFPAKAIRFRATRHQSSRSTGRVGTSRRGAPSGHRSAMSLPSCPWSLAAIAWRRPNLARSCKRVIMFKEIQAACDRIAGAVFYSPCLPSIPLSEITGMQIFCKLDNLQRTGSFKERGARNALAQLSADQRKRGVIAASAGNHAQALAYQGKLLGIPATVVMPQYAPLIKITNCQKLGANVILHGHDFGEAKAHAHQLAAEKGLAYIDGYDDPAIIAGQGTMELEKTVVEGAAATPLAAALSGKLSDLSGKRVVLLLCGGNIDPNILSRVIERGLVADGRLSRFTAVISDRPGGLAVLSRQIAATGASIKQVVHDRTFASSDVSTVSVLCTVETRNHEHLTQLRAHLKEHGVETFDAK